MRKRKNRTTCKKKNKKKEIGSVVCNAADSAVAGSRNDTKA